MDANNEHDICKVHKALGEPEVHVILAATQSGQIGYKNTIPWKLKGDLKRFKEITTGHVVTMGRNTYESLGRALTGRTVIVVSTSMAEALGGEDFYLSTTGRYGEHIHVAKSFKSALVSANGIVKTQKASGFSLDAKIFVAGGVKLYCDALEFAKFVHLTLVHKQPEFEVEHLKWVKENFPSGVVPMHEQVPFPKYDAVIPNFHLRDFTEVMDDGVVLDEQNDENNIPRISHSYHLFMRAPESPRNKATPVYGAEAQFPSLKADPDGGALGG